MGPGSNILWQQSRLATKPDGVRQDSPPKMVSVDYELIVDANEDDRRFDLLYTNVRKFGTIYNSAAGATRIEGRIVRRTVATA